MRITRRAICTALAAWLPFGLRSADVRAAAAGDFLAVTIEVEDSEIITTDLKRIRPAARAEIRFAVATDFIATTFQGDLTTPLARLRLIVLAHARRVLGERPLKEALGSDAMRAVMASVDRELAEFGWGLVVRDHTLRYVAIPAL